MEEMKYVYVIVNSDLDVDAVYSNYTDAVTDCQKQTESFGENMDEWEDFFSVHKCLFNPPTE